MKKALLVLSFSLCSFLVEAPYFEEVWLPEIVIHAKTYDREIFDTALELGADSVTARILVAQARFESDDFSNGLTITHNNVFSMQHPRLRKTTSLGPLATAEGRANTYASYRSVEEAVIDLFFYFEARKIKISQPSITRYVKLLKRKYFFEDSELNYRRGVKQKLNKTLV